MSLVRGDPSIEHSISDRDEVFGKDNRSRATSKIYDGPVHKKAGRPSERPAGVSMVLLHRAEARCGNGLYGHGDTPLQSGSSQSVRLSRSLSTLSSQKNAS